MPFMEAQRKCCECLNLWINSGVEALRQAYDDLNLKALRTWNTQAQALIITLGIGLLDR